jgi:hypothetical protein
MGEKDSQRDWTHDYFLIPIGQRTFLVSRKDLLLAPEPFVFLPGESGIDSCRAPSFSFLSPKAVMIFGTYSFDLRMTRACEELVHFSLQKGLFVVEAASFSGALRSVA